MQNNEEMVGKRRRESTEKKETEGSQNGERGQDKEGRDVDDGCEHQAFLFPHSRALGRVYGSIFAFSRGLTLANPAFLEVIPVEIYIYFIILVLNTHSKEY
jgi:hypothetical protein